MDILNALPNERIMMKIGNKRVPLNIDNIRNLNKWFYPYEEQDDFCSDEAFKKAVTSKPFITLIPLTTKHRRQVHTGAFFKYYNNTKLDLSRYQVFKNDEEADYSDNCLLYALKMGGLDDVKNEGAKTYIKTAHVTKKALHELCDKLDIVIELRRETEIVKL